MDDDDEEAAHFYLFGLSLLSALVSLKMNVELLTLARRRMTAKGAKLIYYLMLLCALFCLRVCV